MGNHGTEAKTLYMREMVRTFMEDHLGCSQKEVERGTGLTYSQVQHAWSGLRKEWEDRVPQVSADAAAEAVQRGMDAVERSQSFVRFIRRLP